MPIYMDRIGCMKNTVKIVRRTYSRRKTTKKGQKTALKSPGKRKKSGYSDGLNAFLLAGAIVALSTIVSFAIIKIHPSLNSEDAPVLQNVESHELLAVEPNQEPVSKKTDTVESPKPEISVSIQKPTQTQSAPSASSARTAPSTTAASAIVPPKPPANLGTLVFVIDDAGNNLRELEPLLRIPYPFTIAVLPGLPYSAEAAKRIRAAGKEVILHQPMEAIGAQNPGPGAIYSGMSASEIRTILARNIAEVGPVAGINNHQGSKVTMDREAMQTILSFCAENGIYFLDSRTTADTVAPVVARQMGIKIGERNVFIDNEQDREAMLRYITGGLERAQKNGSAVMIGHTWSPDLAPLLAEQFPLFVSQGYTIKTASDIIK